MDEKTSMQKLNSGPGFEDLVLSVVREGFANGTYPKFRKQMGRDPSLNEIASPAYLLANSNSDPELYCQLGENIAQDNQFYLKKCPAWLRFSAAQKESSLVDTVEKSIAGHKQGNGKYDYMLGLKVWTTAPTRYKRLEEVNKKELPDQQDDQRLYISYLDWSLLDYEKAVSVFQKLYQLIPEKGLEVHNNGRNVHKKVETLEEAAQEVLQGSIAKIDHPLESKYSPKVNVYLKPNDSYHIRVDIFGTKQEILDYTQKIENMLRDIYQQEKKEMLGETETSIPLNILSLEAHAA